MVKYIIFSKCNVLMFGQWLFKRLRPHLSYAEPMFRCNTKIRLSLPTDVNTTRKVDYITDTKLWLSPPDNDLTSCFFLKGLK